MEYQTKKIYFSNSYLQRIRPNCVIINSDHILHLVPEAEDTEPGVGVEDQDAEENQETPELHRPACLKKKDCPHCYLRYQIKRSCDQEWKKQSWILQDSSKQEKEPIDNMVDRKEEHNDGDSQGNIHLFIVNFVLSFLTMILLSTPNPVVD